MMTTKAKAPLKLVALFALIALISIGAIGAYFYGHDSLSNKYSIAEVETQIVENVQMPSEVTPGTNFTKEVSVTNTSNGTCMVRVFCMIDDSDAAKYASLDYNTNQWSQPDSEGWRYYLYPLEEGETTTPLITTVSISDSISQNEISNFEIPVVVESVSNAIDGVVTDDYQAVWLSHGIQAGVI